MKLKVITISDSIHHPGWDKLKSSLNLFGYDFEHIKSQFEFGFQYKIIREWCNNYKGDCSHALYSDCFDTLALSGPEEVITKFESLDCKMLISAEKNCFPYNPAQYKWQDPAKYPECETPWKYINGGGCLFEIEYFNYLCKKYPFPPESIDPDWLAQCFLNEDQIKLDTNCEIFQTIAFSNKDEWAKDYNNRFYNIATQTHPVFFHGNGHTKMDWVYNILE